MEAATVTQNGTSPTEVDDDKMALPVDSFQEAAEYLRRPFTPQAVKFKVQATWDGGGLVVAYIDARLAVERLNLVIPHKWATTYEPTAQGLMWCHLTVDGITRSDVGEGSGKGLVSDSLKRAAVHFGVGVSLYALPKLRLTVSSGQLRADNRDKYRLTQEGEVHCRELYERWLEAHGKQAFGEPLDHGDVDDAVGGEVETVAEAPPDPSPPAQVGPEPTGAPTDEEAAALLEELLAKKSTLTDKRKQANEGMEKLGAKPLQRYREISTAASSKQLDALITRINNAMDGGKS